MRRAPVPPSPRAPRGSVSAPYGPLGAGAAQTSSDTEAKATALNMAEPPD